MSLTFWFIISFNMIKRNNLFEEEVIPFYQPIHLLGTSVFKPQDLQICGLRK